MKVQMFSWTGQQPCEFINMSFLLCSWLFHPSNVLVFVSSMGELQVDSSWLWANRDSKLKGGGVCKFLNISCRNDIIFV